MIAERRSSSQPHATEGELVRLVDGESEFAERARVLDHLSGCPACSAQLETIRTRSARFSHLLAAWDPAAPGWEPLAAAAPDRQPQPVRPVSGQRAPQWHRLRAAAVLVALLGIGWSVSPVRAWVGERWQTLTTLLGNGPVPDPVPLAEGTDAPGGPRVSFVPTGTDFLIEIDARPTAGALVIRAEDVPAATAEIAGVADGEDLLVLPEGLRIRNSAASTAEYHITLPSSLRSIRVHVSGEVAAAYTLGGLQLPALWRLELGRTPGQ